MTFVLSMTVSAQNKFGCLEITDANRSEVISRTSTIPEFKARCATRAAMPSMVDNSKTKYFPAIINQIGNSCAAVSMGHYQFTYEFAVVMDMDVKAANLCFSYMFLYNLVNNGTDVGSYPWDVADALRYYGAMPKEVWDTEEIGVWATGYPEYYAAMHKVSPALYKINTGKTGGIDEMKRFLYDRGNGSSIGGLLQFSANAHPLEATVYEGESESGYKAIIPKFGQMGMHSMTIVGYDDSVWWDYNENGIKDDDETGAFICVNSWGSDWGDNGMYYAPYRTFTDKMGWLEGGTGNGGLKDAYGFDASEANPSMVVSMTLKHSSRNDISMEIAAYNDKGGFIAKRDVEQFRYKGGDLPVSGKSGDNSEVELAFDISDMNFPDAAQYVLYITSNKIGDVAGEGEVMSCDIYDYRFDAETPSVYHGTMEESGIQNGKKISVEFLQSIELDEGVDVGYRLNVDNRNIDMILGSASEVYVCIDLMASDGSLIDKLYEKNLKDGLSNISLEIGDDVPSAEYVLRISLNNRTEYRRIMVD